MIAVLTILYTLGVVIAFRVIKIPPRRRPIAAAATIGVLLVAAVVVGWQFTAPVSQRATLWRYTVLLVPQVSGAVSKLHAEPNTPLTHGEDLLFEIEPAPFQYRVDQLAAESAAARETIAQLTAGVQAASLAVKKSEAEQAVAQAELESATNIQNENAGAISKLRVTTLEQQSLAAAAAVEQAQATQQQSEAALRSAEHALEGLRAELASAQFDLDQCQVFAPADGYLVNWQVREGTMTTTAPNGAVGTFVDASETHVVAAFPQNLLQNVREGDPVEVAFKSRPGRVFGGKIETVIRATGEGQMTPTGTMPEAASIGSQGMLAVKVVLDDAEAAADLPLGAAAAVAVYTQSGRPFQMISKVYLRMLTWKNYLPF